MNSRPLTFVLIAWMEDWNPIIIWPEYTIIEAGVDPRLLLYAFADHFAEGHVT